MSQALRSESRRPRYKSGSNEFAGEFDSTPPVDHIAGNRDRLPMESFCGPFDERFGFGVEEEAVLNRLARHPVASLRMKTSDRPCDEREDVFLTPAIDNGCRNASRMVGETEPIIDSLPRIAGEERGGDCVYSLRHEARIGDQSIVIGFGQASTNVMATEPYGARHTASRPQGLQPIALENPQGTVGLETPKWLSC